MHRHNVDTLLLLGLHGGLGINHHHEASSGLTDAVYHDLQGVDQSVGFDIEVKMATPPELAITPPQEVERMVTPILEAVQSVATHSSRPIVFSSFDPEICRCLPCCDTPCSRPLHACLWPISAHATLYSNSRLMLSAHVKSECTASPTGRCQCHL